MVRARLGYSFLVVLAVLCGALGCHQGKLYESCSPSLVGNPCEEGLVCVPVNFGACSAGSRSTNGCYGLCLIPCEEASQCPTGAACRAKRDGSLKYCAPSGEAIP